MKISDKFQLKIMSGEIALPKTLEELSYFTSRCKVIANAGDIDLDVSIQYYKEAFIKAHSYKSGDDGSCYISSIKQVINSVKFRKLDDAVLAYHEIRLITHLIQQLIVDGRIRLVGKRVWLITDESFTGGL